MAICFAWGLGWVKRKFSLCKQKIVNEIEPRFFLFFFQATTLVKTKKTCLL